jgi:hypothetical protein
MKPAFQTKFPQRGNCFTACLASLLGLDIADLPAFEDASDNPFIPAKRWLCDRDMNLGHATAEFPPQGYAIAVGPSPRNPNIQHAVVVLDGRIVHDPHPDGLGLIAISRFFTINCDD